MNDISQSSAPRVGSSALFAVAEWLVGDDTGISSEYMAAVFIGGKAMKSKWGDSTPHGAPDLGRCVRLLEKAPCVRNAFPAIRKTSPVWAAYVDHWDELAALWHQGDYHITTGRMNELRASANT